jgi:rod shape-determining protein MreD
VFGALVLGFTWNSLPWGGNALAMRPDLLLLVLLFWALHEPERVGMGLAFLCGILMDVAGSTRMGEHALAYVAAVYLAQMLRVRILKFRLHEQAAHVLLCLVLERLIVGAINLLIDQGFVGPRVLVGCLIAAFLWVPLNWLLFHRLLRGERRTFS